MAYAWEKWHHCKWMESVGGGEKEGMVNNQAWSILDFHLALN